MVRAGPGRAALPREDERARERERDRHEEEQEAGRERHVRVDADLAEEADEERLAHGEPVDRERDEHDEEQHRPHHVVDARREVDAGRLAGEPDREHPHGLQPERQRGDADEQARRGRGTRACPRRARAAAARARSRRSSGTDQASGRRREREKRTKREHDRADDEQRLDPQVGADVVVADREREADRSERERRGAAERPLEQHGAGDVAAAAGVARDVSKIRIASPPIAVGRTWPAAYETKYARVSQRSRSGIPRAASSSCQRQRHRHDRTSMIATDATR